MNEVIRVGIVGAGLALAGCVSEGQYDAAVKDQQQAHADLQQARADAQRAHDDDLQRAADLAKARAQIGRASCRERV